jgi:hypothetical protein
MAHSAFMTDKPSMNWFGREQPWCKIVAGMKAVPEE